MKLLIVCHDCSLYGANLSLLDLLKYYNKNECEISVLIPKKDTEFEERLIKTGVKIIHFDYIYPLKILSKCIIFTPVFISLSSNSVSFLGIKTDISHSFLL